ncbi:MAG: UvrD-helicase domain-containing protein [Blautia sp.]|nr:UvrD-helicase domain-containing protein [Blautia sp.]
MSFSWTDEQRQVIRLRNRSLLVSAAAGSGKTAVLVQRIIGKVTDPQQPLDLDRLLVMTFTRAAAGEMKERLTRALEEELYLNPENEHLLRQINLVHMAQITTIDGFCAYLLRNYFHLIDLDPGFRVAEEGELRLLREDVVNELLEEEYQKGTPEFYRFVESFAPGKNDIALGELIQKLYKSSMSNPYPETWLDECLSSFEEADVSSSDWMQQLWEMASSALAEAKWINLQAREQCAQPGGPYLYEEALQDDLLFLGELEKALKERDYDTVSDLFSDYAYTRLSSKRMKDVDEEKKNQVKANREQMKAVLKECREKLFCADTRELMAAQQLCRVPITELVRLVKRFSVLFSQRKQEKNIIDFYDMEHFALNLLTDQNGEFSPAARELSERYDEIMIDEYQDSNLVQEYIAQAVSGWAKGKKNLFMVGDVKQSIYRFRLARPELFLGKSHTFAKEEGPEQKIILSRNFRSRKQVLDCVNFIFSQVMGEDLGGICYDEEAKLYPGADYPPVPVQETDFVFGSPTVKAAESSSGNNESAYNTSMWEESLYQTEVMVIEKDSEELDELSAREAREAEAAAVAERIQELAGTLPIWDRSLERYRPARYGDMVVLLRSAQGWAEVFSEVFTSRGIGCYAAARTGYFSAKEVVTILNLLRVCDNPLQDIPLAGVLISPVVGLSNEELAVLRIQRKTGKLYESIRSFLGDGQISLEGFDSIRAKTEEKLGSFIRMLDDFRQRAAYTPIHKLIMELLEETGYGRYVKALPDGSVREANLLMLVEKAKEYEKTSYHGLFRFIRYIEKLQKYEIDFGEANLAGESENVVRIMTIHASKGLEFPIVFAAGMGKSFNFMDLNEELLIHPRFGLAMDVMQPEKRLKTRSVQRNVLRQVLRSETLGEELRILYVAMTRAKEKLILAGTLGKLEEKAETYSRLSAHTEELFPLYVRERAKSYWDFVLPALCRHRCFDAWFAERGFFTQKQDTFYNDVSSFICRILTPIELAVTEVERQADQEEKRQALWSFDQEKVYDPVIRQRLEECYGFIYPFAFLKELPVKMSVSELKKRSWHNEEAGVVLYQEPEIVPLIPGFIQEKQSTEEKQGGLVGADRGTAYHRFMECLDYRRTSSPEELSEQLELLFAQKKMTAAQISCIDLKDMEIFLKTALGKRMKAACLSGLLIREQPFVISKKAREIDGRWDTDESILIQGIIDAYFLEGDELVLVDYKTDRVRPEEEQKLIDLYHVQLEDYAAALERLTGHTVKEKLIYSFALGKQLQL